MTAGRSTEEDAQMKPPFQAGDRSDALADRSQPVRPCFSYCFAWRWQAWFADRSVVHDDNHHAHRPASGPGPARPARPVGALPGPDAGSIHFPPAEP